jgi:hypothetical protein
MSAGTAKFEGAHWPSRQITDQFGASVEWQWHGYIERSRSFWRKPYCCVTLPAIEPTCIVLGIRASILRRWQSADWATMMQTMLEPHETTSEPDKFTLLIETRVTLGNHARTFKARHFLSRPTVSNKSFGLTLEYAAFTNCELQQPQRTHPNLERRKRYKLNFDSSSPPHWILKCFFFFRRSWKYTDYAILVQLTGKADSVHDKKAYGGAEVQLHPLLISALSGCECSVRLGRSTPETIQGTHYVTRRVGARLGLPPATRQDKTMRVT